MTVRDLIERLQRLNPEAVVLAYDADIEQPAVVQGLLFNDKFVTIQTNKA